MSLPKLETPTYELTLPSTGKKFKYRPFLVKEHKSLLMMKDSGEDELSRVMAEIVDICTFHKMKMNDLPNFDVEYAFLKIRSKSIGENLDLILTCRDCSNKIPFKINLDAIQLERNDNHKQKFMLTDKVGVEMKYPRFKLDLYELIESGLDNYFGEIEKCIKAIYTSDGKYFEITIDDKEELTDFVASMNTEQFGKIEEFFQTMPRLSHVTQITCDKCGTINKARVEGLSNFFV
jgi:hypothetical protein